MAGAGAPIGEAATRVGHELPVVAGRVQRDPGHPEGGAAADLAAGLDRAGGLVALPTRAADDLAHPARRVDRAGGVQRSEALVGVVLAREDQVGASVVERLPEPRSSQDFFLSADVLIEEGSQVLPVKHSDGSLAVIIVDPTGRPYVLYEDESAQTGWTYTAIPGQYGWGATAAVPTIESDGSPGIGLMYEWSGSYYFLNLDSSESYRQGQVFPWLTEVSHNFSQTFVQSCAKPDGTPGFVATTQGWDLQFVYQVYFVMNGQVSTLGLPYLGPWSYPGSNVSGAAVAVTGDDLSLSVHGLVNFGQGSGGSLVSGRAGPGTNGLRG